MNTAKANPLTLNRILAWVGLVVDLVAAWLMQPAPIVAIILGIVGVVGGVFGLNSTSKAVGIGAIVLGALFAGLSIWSLTTVAAKPAGW
jgi:hypothetical protein